MSNNMQNYIANFIAISNNALFISTLLWFLFMLILSLNFTFYKRQTIHKRRVRKSHEIKFSLRFGSEYFPQKRYIAMIMLVLLLFVAFVPLYNGNTLAQVSRGVVGDLSITGLLVQVLIWISYIWSLRVESGSLAFLPRVFCLIIFILGLILYLATFNYVPFDLYAFGYYPKYLLLMVFILQLIFWYINRVFALIWLIALIAFYYKLQIGVNLWDYLLDPVLWLFCGYTLLFKQSISQIDKK